MLAAGCAENGSFGTSHVVSHTESDKAMWFGGQRHVANTAYKNSDGSTSIETETTTVKDGTTIILRDKKTTNADGSAGPTHHEKHTIVQGSDKVEVTAID